MSWLRLDTNLRAARAGQPLDWLGTLKRQGHLDREGWVGEAQPLVRVEAVKLPAAVAAARRRKARQNCNQRWRPSPRHRALLGWASFVTNVARQIWSAQTVAQVDGLRWRNETIFKARKTHFRLTEVPRGPAAQLAAMIYARFVRQLDYHGRKERRRRKHFGKPLLDLS